jgi:dienelactone hydrolase
MINKLVFFIIFTFTQMSSHAQFLGSGPELDSLSQFKDGNFKFQSVKNISWPQIVNEGRGYVDRSQKVWVPAHLFLPANNDKKVPAMVVMHGIGGLYNRSGQKRAYWEYAEMMAKNGVAAILVDSHGARGYGVSNMLESTSVSVYSFAADAFSAADLLRTHPLIDPNKIGIMGFSKGGMTTLLVTDQRFANSLSASKSKFNLHIPIYPGCQNFPEKLQPTMSPVHMLLGEKDNYTGITGCFEIEKKLKASTTPTHMIIYKGAVHSWDESLKITRTDDVSSEDCRWILKDGGGVWGGDNKLINSAEEGQAYFKGCVKKAEIYVGRVEPANTEGRKAVLDIIKNTFKN